MKKGAIALLIILVLVMILLVYQPGIKEKVAGTGNTITGNATSAGVSVSITIAAPPNLDLYLPENKTYFTGTDLWLNFSALSADTVKYSIDGGENITLTGNTTLNTIPGQHTLFIFANNSFGNVTNNTVFTVNPSLLSIKYRNYKNNRSSTDFNKSSFEDAQSLSGIILEHSGQGKIAFNQPINLTESSDVDIDSYINISRNLISINTTALPNFNKSATLSLEELSFTNPGVLKDGTACPESICTEVSYSGGTFIFNVTQFSNYSAYETASSEEESSSGSGGGGGSGGTPSASFTADKEQISVSLRQGEVITENLTITNKGSETISISIDNTIKEFVIRSEEAVVLSPGESKVVPLHFLARVDAEPNLYLGKLILSSGNAEKEILVALEVESKGALLDVRGEISRNYKSILPGEYILSEIRLFNLGDEGRKDITLEYVIKDYEGNEIARETESLAIETQLTFLKEIHVPEGTNAGTYILYIKATYEDKIASASDNFKVVSPSIFRLEHLYLLAIIILLAALFMVVYMAFKRFRKTTGTRVSSSGFEEYRKNLKKRLAR